MRTTKDLTFSAAVYIYPILLVLAIWFAFWLEQRFGFNLRAWGIKPRELIGLRGVFFSPFLHGDTTHLLSNSLPLLLLSLTLFYFYRGIAFNVIIFGGILTGILTWIIGRGGSVHIGASGVVYLLASFLFFKGIWSKNMRLIAVSLVVVFIYGSLIWGVFPGKPKISWEGHLSGFVSGIIFALYYRKYQLLIDETVEKKKRLSKREIEFLNHFDEQGNFVPFSEQKKREEEQKQSNTLDVEIVYQYKKSSAEKVNSQNS